MSYSEMFGEVNAIRRLMADDESVRLYDARIEYLVKRDFHAYTRILMQSERKWTIPMLQRFSAVEPIRKIVIWGYGWEAEYIRRLLHRSEYAQLPIYFCDSRPDLRDKVETTDMTEEAAVETVVISPETLIRDHTDAVVIIAPRTDFLEIYERLGNLSYPSWRILYPEAMYGNHLYGITGWQYFDYFLPQEDEVFVDVGSLNGDTSVEFAKWSQGNYDGIFAFEANMDMESKCIETFKAHHLQNMKLITKAVWDRECTLRFHAEEGLYPSGSRITDQDGNMEVETDTIDHMLSGERVTFIKMDIEGSEYRALTGAAETINKWKPRMAISLYHKPEDILELPYIIRKICPEYRFAIRQYASNLGEMVLYAF